MSILIVEQQVSFFDMVLCVASAVDLISPEVANHHKRVAIITYNIAIELGLTREEQKNLILAGLLHDVGALSLHERLATLQFEDEGLDEHGEMGYLLLKEFAPLAEVAKIVRHHHLPWNDGQGAEHEGEPVPIASHILHLADRIDVLLNRNEEVISQGQDVCQKIRDNSGQMFVPYLVQAMCSLAQKEHFWLDIVSCPLETLTRNSRLAVVELDLVMQLELAKIFSLLIDFRSRFTATHSSGVAASAEILAQNLGFSKRESMTMRVAGYLHDLGKLVVPVEILEKPGRLTQYEYNIIRSHTYYTYRILETIPALDTINMWGSFHHERLDGQGYPFHHSREELPLGSQVMAVADVFTAITEDRPYRKAMNKTEVIKILNGMSENNALNGDIVAMVSNHYDELDDTRHIIQKKTTRHYRQLR